MTSRGAHARFVADARAAIGDPSLRRLLDSATARLAERRSAAVAALPEWEELRERAHRIRQDTVQHLDDHVAEFERQATARGAHVHHAATAGDARRLVLDLARHHGVDRVVKGKSMVSEEIHLNEALADAGISPIESDLGEFIVQLAGQTPSHIIVPALHLSQGDVARLFADKLGMRMSDDVTALTHQARQRLRAEFAAAGMGTSGVNLAVAETGTLVLLENEGNVRLSTSMPRIHVALMGRERLVPRVADLAVLLALLPRSATGQPMTTYTSLLSGPRREAEADGPDAVHVVILDNGRSRMAADAATREALACIRCGACLNACPVYRTIGGHAYGTVYGGPIGSVISPYLQPGGRAMELPFASSLCGACADVCPVKIDLPELLVRLRARAMTGREPASGRPASLERLALRVWAWAMAGPTRYRLVSRALRVGLGPLARNGVIRRLPGAAGGWTASRDLPAPAPKTFHDLWRERTARDGPGLKGGAAADSDRADVAASARRGPGSPRPPTPTHEQLLRSFTAMSEDAEAPVAVVATMEAARARVQEILRDEGARSVALSPNAAAAPWSCVPPNGLKAITRSAASPDRESVLAADAGVTVASFGLADTGTLVLCSSAGDHRLDSLLPPLHIALLRAGDILPDLPALLDRLAAERRFNAHSVITFVRGPSRTADIELTLILGVHGPEKVRVIVAPC